MNLRKEIITGVVLILVVFVLYSIIDFWQSEVEKTNVEDFIKEDLMSKHPLADEIEIIEMKEKLNEEGGMYYSIKAKVTEGLETPCPVRIHYYYNYPEQNFVTQPPEYITKNCQVCEVKPCTLTFKEEAIIASHTLDGTDIIHNFILDNPGAYPIVEKEEDGWKVQWINPSDLDGYEILLDAHGEIIAITELYIPE